jgi:non-ribosomal peptide synthetase component F
VPARALAAPAHFIRNHRITWWFSVASVAMLLARQGVLRPGVFSSLKVSLLCGEPLPVRSAAAWAAAAPSSTLHNVYGPTETTMELAFHRFDPTEAARRGVVAIGVPFADHAHVLLDDAGAEVVGEGQGELYVSGPQLAVGYWKDPDRTAQAFVTLPARAGRWYRTGDLVERDACGVYHFVSRVDFQVKLRGHRIELGEVEAALREAVRSDLAVVIPHPFDGANAQGLVAFAVGEPRGDGELRAALAARVPASMIPDRFVWLDTLPLNANRKVDRGALADRLTRGE